MNSRTAPPRRRRRRSAFTMLEMAITVFIMSLVFVATIGLFGVTAFVVGQRQHEVGVRLTLGAHGSDILRMLLRDGLRPVTIGLGCGLIVALIAGIFGFGGVASTAAGVARILFFIFLVVFLVTIIAAIL